MFILPEAKDYSYDSDNPKMLNSVVCVADVLGFKELIMEYCISGQGNDLLTKFNDTHKCNLYRLKTSELVSNLKAYTDNLVIGWPVKPGETLGGTIELANLLAKLAEYQLALALNGFFIRGAVTVGLHYMNEHIVYGPAVIEAYQLEISEAIYPRIILSEKTKQIIQRDMGIPSFMDKQRNYVNEYVLFSSDKKWFLNYLTPTITFGYDLEEYDYAVKLLSIHKNNLEANLIKYKSKNNIINKYSWLAQYHNYFCRTNFPKEQKIFVSRDYTEHNFLSVDKVMSGETLWSKITQELKRNPTELSTVPSNNRKPLWFYAYMKGDYLYIDNSKSQLPSTKLSQPREIKKKDFLTVYSYYHQWASGETNLRQRVRELSRNTAYIFGLISKYE